MTHSSAWTVTTWNLQGSRGVDGAAVGNVVREHAPDVVAVQEIRRRDAHRLAAALDMRVDWALKHFPFTWLMWWRAEGMAILTPHELAAPGSTEISVRRSLRWDWRRRIAQWACIRRGDDALFVVNIHLSPHALGAERLAEAQRVAEIVAEHSGDQPVVIAGDFNDDTDPAVIDALPAVEHVAAGFTNPSSAPAQALDHVLVPEESIDVDVRVPPGGPTWAALSDHVPVTVRFTVPDPPATAASADD